MDIKTVVGLDLETTALEPGAGEIIEVAAIRYDWKTGEEVGRFVQLCRSRDSLPTAIEQLTGITDAMLTDKPFFKDVVTSLKDFIGADIVFAHNAPFDIGWLSQHGLKIDNPVWDTFPLASVTWPEAPSYNLGMLAKQLALPKGEEHRAAGDVIISWALLQHIRAKLTLPKKLGSVIHSILERTDQLHYEPLFLFSEASKPTSSSKTNGQQPTTRPAIASIEAILGAEGVLAKKITGFSFRSQQLKMAEAAYQLFTKHGVGLLEAGTGLGKTYAYLVAGLQWLQEETGLPAGRQAARQVVISTHTRYLQDQLLLIDLPRLLAASGVQLKVAALKGRKNYVCTQRLARVIAEGRFTQPEAWHLLKVLIWLEQGGAGDLERLNFSHQASFGLLNRIHADVLRCRTLCSRTTCAYHTARQKAHEADFVVINHALLVQGSAAEAPQYKSVVVDEAHHLAEAARAASRRDFSEENLQEIVGGVVRAARPAAGKVLESQLTRGGQEVLAAWQAVMDAIGRLSPPARSNRLLLGPVERRGSAWGRIGRLAGDFSGRLQLLIGLGRGVQLKLTAEQRLIWQEAEQAAETFLKEWRMFVDGARDRLQWLEFREDFRTKKTVVEAGDVARDVQQLLSPIFSAKQGVVLTSATLTTSGTFAYIKDILGLSEVAEFNFTSPFQYRDNMLVYVVENGPHPVDQNFDTYAAQVIETVATLLAGHTLVLLTSRKALGALYKILNLSLYKANIRLLAQGMTGGRRNIVERFKQNHNAVLLGTASFWEGLDLPGENVTALVIPRLPFPPPDDPLTMVDGRGNDTFIHSSLPQMLLRLRQGVGRLLRTETDRGVVVLLDARFLQANYRAAVLTTLPAATIKIGRQEDLERAVTEFFGEEQLATWRTQHKNQQKVGG